MSTSKNSNPPTKVSKKSASSPIDPQLIEVQNYIKEYPHDLAVMQTLGEGSNPEIRGEVGMVKGTLAYTEAKGFLGWLKLYRFDTQDPNPDLKFLHDEMSRIDKYNEKLAYHNHAEPLDKLITNYTDEVIKDLKKNKQVILQSSQHLPGGEGHRVYKRYVETEDGYELRVSNAGGEVTLENQYLAKEGKDAIILAERQKLDNKSIYPTLVYKIGSFEEVEKAIRAEIEENTKIFMGVIKQSEVLDKRYGPSNFKGVGHEIMAIAQTTSNCPFASFQEVVRDTLIDHPDKLSQKNGAETLHNVVDYIYKTSLPDEAQRLGIKAEELTTSAIAINPQAQQNHIGFDNITKKIAIEGIANQFSSENRLDTELTKNLFKNLIGVTDNNPKRFSDWDLPVNPLQFEGLDPTYTGAKGVILNTINANNGLTEDNQSEILAKCKLRLVENPNVHPSLKTAIIYNDEELKRRFIVETSGLKGQDIDRAMETITPKQIKDRLLKPTIQREIAREILSETPKLEPNYNDNIISINQRTKNYKEHFIGKNRFETATLEARENLAKQMPIILESHQKKVAGIITLPKGSKVSKEEYFDTIVQMEAKKHSDNSKSQTFYIMERKDALKYTYKNDVLKMYPLDKFGKQAEKQISINELAVEKLKTNKSVNNNVKESSLMNTLKQVKDFFSTSNDKTSTTSKKDGQTRKHDL